MGDSTSVHNLPTTDSGTDVEGARLQTISGESEASGASLSHP